MIKDQWPAANFLVIFPPSVCIQRDRLAHRGSETVKSMPGRIMGGFTNMLNDRFLNDPVMRCVYNNIIVNNDLDNTTKLVDKLVQALYAEEIESNKNDLALVTD